MITNRQNNFSLNLELPLQLRWQIIQIDHKLQKHWREKITLHSQQMSSGSRFILTLLSFKN